ncbi:YcxB family protein [Kitasatospora azatica]|uniref:YcxB family protein n=1 Tax=Kitasatospora azatica TaxID=58347 RepID=UPI00056AEFAB|nr:YcxB family protein [Kitasatospora azatica]
MDVTATFQLTPREFRQAIRNLPTIRRIALLSVLFTVAGLVELFTSNHPQWWLIVTGPGLLVFLELAAVRGATRRSAPLLANPWTVRVTEGSYRLETNASSAKVGWSNYREVTERAGFWYLHQANRAVSFLPQQAFNETDRAQVAAFFAAKLPAQPRPWYRALI